MFTTTEHKERICNSILTILLTTLISAAAAVACHGSSVVGCFEQGTSCRSRAPLLIDETARVVLLH